MAAPAGRPAAYGDPVPESAIDAYAAAFVARGNAGALPLSGVVGLHGVISAADPRLTRLLITDDRAYEELAVILPDVRAGVISVFAAATRCAQLVSTRPEWKPSVAQAMICPDLGIVPHLGLADGLTLHRVRRLPEDSAEGVGLRDAVELALLADGSATGASTALAASLRSLAPAFRLLAAVDAEGVVRATSGCGVFGAQAVVIFVNTDPSWRRRGVGLSMTAAALGDARDAGAKGACLDASDAGLSTYRRLGFEIVAPMIRFATAD